MSAARSFVLELGRALHALGSPAYRVEDAMLASARALGLQGSFFATPTAIFAALAAAGERSETVLLRVQPGEHDLGRLAALYRARDEVAGGAIDAAAGLERIGAIMAAPASSGQPAQALAFGLASASAAVLLGGGLAETAIGGVAGLLVGSFGWFARARPRLVRVFEAAACAGAALFVAVAAAFWPLDVGTATIASIIALLPGVPFTAALAELAMQHLAAGSARLLGSLMLLLTMVIGVGLGTRVGVVLVGVVPAAAPSPLPDLLQPVAVAAATLAFAVLLRARRAQFGAVLAGVVVGQLGLRLGGLLFQDELRPFAGALAVTIAANVYARWRRSPAAVVSTPGLLLLVPASIGFRGLTTALQQDYGVGAQLAFQMLLVGGSLVAGLLVAGLLVPPPLDVEPDSAGGGGAAGGSRGYAPRPPEPR